jgi:D-lactate dehydrogenase (cytochrome)
MSTVTADLIAALKAVVGPAGWLEDSAAIEPHLVERRGLYRGATALVLRPASTEEVADIVGMCAAARVAIVPQGGNTGLCGGGVPAEDGHNVVVALDRMNRIRGLDPVNFTVTAEAGVILANLQTAAEAADRFFPLSLGAEGTCQIGGNISTNAGGIQVLRWGNMRDQVLGLEVVLPDGRVWHGLRTLRKDNTGTDLKHLFIGAEGTLGIVTAACLRLYPKPKAVATALLGLDDLDQVATLFARARAASGDQLTAFELMPRVGIELAIKHVPGLIDPLEAPRPWYALIETSSPRAEAALAPALESLLESALEAGEIGDGTIAQTLAQRRALWGLREGIVEAQRLEGGSIKHDVAVPVALVPDFIRRATALVTARLPGIRVVAFGHFGDGNIHFNLTQPEGMEKARYLGHWNEFSRLVHDLVAELHGSISAEHGIGRLKIDELVRYKPALDLELMARIKTAFDPEGIMNPGKVLRRPHDRG